MENIAKDETNKTSDISKNALAQHPYDSHSDSISSETLNLNI